MKRVLSDTYFLGRKCIFCDKYGLYRLKNNKIKCKHCKKYYSLRKLQRDIQILYYFYLEISARKTAKEYHSSRFWLRGIVRSMEDPTLISKGVSHFLDIR